MLGADDRCAIKFFSFQIHPLLNENLKDPSILEDLCGTLKSSMKFIEHIFSNEEAPINSSSDIPVSFIVQCFSLYVRIVIHLKLKVHRILENLSESNFTLDENSNLNLQMIIISINIGHMHELM